MRAKVLTDPTDSEIVLSTAALDALMPLHLRLDGAGRILGAGRTLAKLCPDGPLEGEGFFERFRIRKPRKLTDIETLRAARRQKLVVESIGAGAVKLRGMVVGADAPHGLLLNFSLAGDIAQITKRFHLKGKDFAPADSSVDLLYLIETQAAVLIDLQGLTKRLQESKAEAERQALTDALTGLPNRRALTGALSRRLGAQDRRADRQRFAVMQIDLDNFKNVNDTIGHAAGDEVLKHVSSVLRSEIRGSDMLARIGGDEFVAVIGDDPNKDEIAGISHRIIDRLSVPIPFEDRSCKIGASIGVTFCEGDGIYDADRLLVDADLALYESKRAGRGRLRFFVGEMREKHEAVNQLATEIDDAIASGAFEPFFQPQVNAITGRIEGFEALARWRHPQRGILPPSAFLYIAEQANLLTLIDDVIITKAFHAASTWRKRGFSVPKISINVTAARLNDPYFIERLIWAAGDADLDPKCIGVEILESVLLDDESERLIDNIRRLGERGFHLELDDFGTGHASISNLHKVRVSVVKIDRSLISGVATDPQLKKIAGAIIKLAHNLDVIPLAEGVETAAEMKTLIDLGCSIFQGFGVARPMPEAEVEGWIAAGRWETFSPTARDI